jgi:hypothetical protein
MSLCLFFESEYLFENIKVLVYLKEIINDIL